ncbi:MAG: Fic protein [Microgenomates group bacterium Gr01-1014_16]|nr:MAG: Fic protein [Microgenomates group bacterium Gr01-1014_16]
MNDTNLNGRQKKIIDVLKQMGSVSRLALADIVSPDASISRITFIRDLNRLIDLKIVKVSEKGKNTTYGLAETNPLLTYLDLDSYFKTEAESRVVNKNFNNVVFSRLNSLYSPDEIKLWERSKNIFKEAGDKLDPSIYRRELERFIIELSWKSSQIEGNTYTLIETETLIKQNIKAQGHSDEEAVMILNHKKAFDVILHKKDSFKKLDFSDIIQLHQVLTNGLVTSGIRSQKVRISGTRYEPLSDKHQIESVLRQLIEIVNKTEFPPEKALILSIMIAYLQPFSDGNKRTSRMLSNAILLAYDYFPLSYRSIDVNEYRSAMIVFYEINNLYNFKSLYMKQLQFAIDNYFL